MEVLQMGRRNRSPEEQERRAKIRELLQLSNVSSMEDIQSLFKETIAEFGGVIEGLKQEGKRSKIAKGWQRVQGHEKEGSRKKW